MNLRFNFIESWTGQPNALNLRIQPEGDKTRLTVTFDNEDAAVDGVFSKVESSMSIMLPDGEYDLFDVFKNYWKLEDGDYIQLAQLNYDGEEQRIYLNREEDGTFLEIMVDGVEVTNMAACSADLLERAAKRIEWITGQHPGHTGRSLTRVELGHVQYQKEEVLSEEILRQHVFAADDIDLWVEVNIPAMKVGITLSGSDSCKVDKEKCFDTQEAFIDFLGSVNAGYEWFDSEDALIALGATKVEVGSNCTTPAADISDEEVFTLVCRGWVEGLVRLVGPSETTFGGGVACKIGEYAFWFGGEKAEDYDVPLDYLAGTCVDCVLSDIASALESFRDSENFKDEFAYYMWYLRKNSKNCESHITSVMEFLNASFELSAEHKRCIENVLCWAFKNLPDRKMREDLVRATLDFGMTESEIEGVLVE